MWQGGEGMVEGQRDEDKLMGSPHNPGHSSEAVKHAQKWDSWSRIELM